MNIIAVDDERLALENITEKIKQVLPEDECIGFMDPTKALEYAKENEVAIACLDIEMFGMTGLELAKELKDLHPKVKIIFATGFSEYAINAIHMRASGYLVKPIELEDLKRELEYACESMKSKRKVRIQTFGGFDVYVNGNPVSFKRNKSKELLAYLVDKKGNGATTAEMSAVLFEDKAYGKSVRSQFQTIVTDLMTSLKEAGIEDIIIKKWNHMSVNPQMFDCDYYDFLKGDAYAVNSYHGDYMVNYSWAEFTMGYLEQSKIKSENV